MKNQGAGMADHVFPGIAEHSLGCRVEIDDQAIGIGQENGPASMFQNAILQSAQYRRTNTTGTPELDQATGDRIDRTGIHGRGNRQAAASCLQTATRQKTARATINPPQPFPLRPGIQANRLFNGGIMNTMTVG